MACDKETNMLILTGLFMEVFLVKLAFELGHERWEECLQPALRKGTQVRETAHGSINLPVCLGTSRDLGRPVHRAMNWEAKLTGWVGARNEDLIRYGVEEFCLYLGGNGEPLNVFELAMSWSEICSNKESNSSVRMNREGGDQRQEAKSKGHCKFDMYQIMNNESDAEDREFCVGDSGRRALCRVPCRMWAHPPPNRGNSLCAAPAFLSLHVV